MTPVMYDAARQAHQPGDARVGERPHNDAAPRDTGIATKISRHSFRATGITADLQNGGKLDVAQQMAGHSNAKTTGLYDRRNDAVDLDEVERIAHEVNRVEI